MKKFEYELLGFAPSVMVKNTLLVKGEISAERLTKADRERVIRDLRALRTRFSKLQLLDGMLNSRGLFGKKEDPELRACAAMALGRVGSDAAIATLRRASNEKEILVRNAVNRVLRGGTAA